jgi:sec-independent protein translocase protein TatA
LSAAARSAEVFAMGGLSIWHWIIVIAVILLLFGRGKISELMGDVAQGIKAFKKGMSEDDTAKAETEPVKTIEHQQGSAQSAKPSADLQNRAATEKRFEGGTA